MRTKEERDFATVGVFVERKKDGSVFFLNFFNTEPRGNMVVSRLKFPTETQEGSEDPWQTICTGMRNELDSDPERSQLTFRSLVLNDSGNPEHLFVVNLAGDPGKSLIHQKFVFLLEITGGRNSLRTLRMTEPDGTVLDPPQFTEAGELLRLMEERGTEFHRCVLFKALEFLARDKDVCDRYVTLLGKPEYHRFQGSGDELSIYFRRLQDERRPKGNFAQSCRR